MRDFLQTEKKKRQIELDKLKDEHQQKSESKI